MRLSELVVVDRAAPLDRSEDSEMPVDASGDALDLSDDPTDLLQDTIADAEVSFEEGFSDDIDLMDTASATDGPES